MAINRKQNLSANRKRNSSAMVMDGREESSYGLNLKRNSEIGTRNMGAINILFSFGYKR